MSLHKSILYSLLFLASISTVIAQGGGDKVGNGNEDVQAMLAIQEANEDDIQRCDFNYVPAEKICDYISRQFALSFKHKERRIRSLCCD